MNEQKSQIGAEEARKERGALLLERRMLRLRDEIKDSQESIITQLNRHVVWLHQKTGIMLNRVRRWTGINPALALQDRKLAGRFASCGIRLDRENIVAMMRFAGTQRRWRFSFGHTWEQIRILLQLDDQKLVDCIMYSDLGFKIPLDEFPDFVADSAAARGSSSNELRLLFKLWESQPVDLRIPLRSRAVREFLRCAASGRSVTAVKSVDPEVDGSMNKFFVRVHRGTHEIGGSCIELMASGKRILLDLGLPLAEGNTERLVPPKLRKALSDPALLGVVISHAHPDHYGRINLVPAGVPVYIGAAADRILREARFFGAPGWSASVTVPIAHNTPFSLGPFTITPFLVDHSAFDAYALLVEAGGKRLFYSGDLRAHGRKPGTFAALLDGSPGKIDTLLLEGTSIRPDADEPVADESEQDVENACVGTFQATRCLALVFTSAQNIDRMVSLYRACRRTGRVFVMDLFTATMAAATGCASIPQADWDGVRVWLPQSQRRRVIESGEFWRTDRVRHRRIFSWELGRNPERFVVVCRGSTLSELILKNCVAGASAVWSMWQGYLEKQEWAAAKAMLYRYGIPLVVHHASGHARVADLKRLVAALDPGKVVPIHTAHPDLFAEHFANTNVKFDGEWWEV